MKTNKHRQRAILVFDSKGNRINRFDMLTDAAKHYNIKSIGNITDCCSGKSHTCYKMIFIYEDEFNDELLKDRVAKADKNYYRYNAMPVIMLDDTGIEMGRYDSAYKVEEDGFDRTCVRKVCRGEQSHHAGFKWAYAE